MEQSEILLAEAQLVLHALEAFLQIFFKYRPQSVLFCTVDVKFFVIVKRIKLSHNAVSPSPSKNIFNNFLKIEVN